MLAHTKALMLQRISERVYVRVLICMCVCVWRYFDGDGPCVPLFLLVSLSVSSNSTPCIRVLVHVLYTSNRHIPNNLLVHARFLLFLSTEVGKKRNQMKMKTITIVGMDGWIEMVYVCSIYIYNISSLYIV